MSIVFSNLNSFSELNSLSCSLSHRNTHSFINIPKYDLEIYSESKLYISQSELQEFKLAKPTFINVQKPFVEHIPCSMKDIRKECFRNLEEWTQWRDNTSFLFSNSKKLHSMSNYNSQNASSIQIHPPISLEQWKECMRQFSNTEHTYDIQLGTHCRDGCACPSIHQWIQDSYVTRILQPSNTIRWLGIPICIGSLPGRKYYMLAFLDRSDCKIYFWTPHCTQIPIEISQYHIPLQNFITKQTQWKLKYTIFPLKLQKEVEVNKNIDLDYWWCIMACYLHCMNNREVEPLVNNVCSSLWMVNYTVPALTKTICKASLKVKDKEIPLNFINTYFNLEPSMNRDYIEAQNEKAAFAFSKLSS